MEKEYEQTHRETCRDCLLFQAKESGVYPNVADGELLKNFKPKELQVLQKHCPGSTCRLAQRRVRN